jgi:hypothetical protein
MLSNIKWGLNCVLIRNITFSAGLTAKLTLFRTGGSSLEYVRNTSSKIITPCEGQSSFGFLPAIDDQYPLDHSIILQKNIDPQSKEGLCI